MIVKGVNALISTKTDVNLSQDKFITESAQDPVPFTGQGLDAFGIKHFIFTLRLGIILDHSGWTKTKDELYPELSSLHIAFTGAGILFGLQPQR